MITASRAVERLGASQRGLADKLPAPKVARMAKLNQGDPSFATPEYVVQAAIKAMKEGYTHYPPAAGDPQLREAIAVYQSKISGVPVSPSEVLVTSGGTGAISSAMAALLNPGDEVILLDPTYSLYADSARLVGAPVVSVPLAPDFSLDVDAVRAAVTPRTRMLVLNFPSNPTGQLLERQELEGLAEIAVQNDLLVLSDEVYDQLVFTGKSISAFGHPALTDRTVLVNSFSKTYAMTGWRVGWAVARASILKSILTVNRTAVGTTNHIGQRAGLEALTNEAEDRKWRAWMLAQYQAQRQAMWEGLSRIPGVHAYELEAAFYAWIRYDAPLSSVEMMKYLYERGLNLRPGIEYGAMGENHLRLSFAPAAEVIDAGLAILKAAMEELRG